MFNGPDEQFVSGRVMGADGGIGGTYAVMPELFLKMNELIEKGDIPACLLYTSRGQGHSRRCWNRRSRAPGGGSYFHNS